MEILMASSKFEAEHIIMESWRVGNINEIRIKFLPGCELPKEQMKTQIFSALPMCGKSLTKSIYDITKFQIAYHFEQGILDFPLSRFKWLLKFPHVKNPEFPKNYVDFVEYNIGKYACILISSDREVRREMKRREVNYSIFYPSTDSVKEFLILAKKDKKRSKEFLSSYSENVWSEISDVKKDEFPRKIELHNCYEFWSEFPNYLIDGVTREEEQEF